MDTTVPSVRVAPLTASYTYQSAIPDQCVGGTGSKRVPCVLGVDEAGRGPVLGPLVYGIAYCPEDQQEMLRDVGFAGTPPCSHRLQNAHSRAPRRAARGAARAPRVDGYAASSHAGWAVRVMSPQDISAGMLKRRAHNLNAQSSDATVLLIQGILDSGVDITKVRCIPHAPDLCRYGRRPQLVQAAASVALPAAHAHRVDRDAQGRRDLPHCRRREYRRQGHTRPVLGALDVCRAQPRPAVLA